MPPPNRRPVPVPDLDADSGTGTHTGTIERAIESLVENGQACYPYSSLILDPK